LCLVESSRSWLGGKEIFRKKSSCMSLHLPLGMRLCFLWAECPIMVLVPHAGMFVSGLTLSSPDCASCTIIPCCVLHGHKAQL
jgi:hypothetical protein